MKDYLDSKSYTDKLRMRVGLPVDEGAMKSERNANQIDNPNNPQIVSFPIDIKHPAVITFAKAMDDVLTDNDYKGGWDDCEISYLQARLVEEMGEYFRSVAINADCKESYGKAKPINRRELIDIANFAMMLWERMP